MGSENIFNSKENRDHIIISLENILHNDDSEKNPENRTLNEYRNYIAEKLKNEFSILIHQKKIKEVQSLFINSSTKWKSEILNLSNYESSESLFFDKVLVEECENEIINILEDK